MDKNSICENCNRPKKEHTPDEILSCKLEIYKNDELTENDWIDYFNEIKNGEYSRMKKS